MHRFVLFLTLPCLLATTVAACGSDSASSAGTSSAGSDAGNSAGNLDSGATTTTDATTSADAKMDTTKTDTKTTVPCKPWLTPAEWNCPQACDESGENCVDTHCGYDSMDKIACIPNGAHQVGEDCSDGKGCVIGLCVSDQNGAQACAPFCTADSQCDSGACNKIEGKTYSVCDVSKYVACSPLSPKCEAGQGCYLVNAEFACIKAGSTGKGETCSTNTDCAPGLTCAGAAGTSKGVCRLYCSKTKTPNGCDSPDTNCSSLGSGVGYCEQ